MTAEGWAIGNEGTSWSLMPLSMQCGTSVPSLSACEIETPLSFTLFFISPPLFGPLRPRGNCNSALFLSSPSRAAIAGRGAVFRPLHPPLARFFPRTLWMEQGRPFMVPGSRLHTSLGNTQPLAPLASFSPTSALILTDKTFLWYPCWGRGAHIAPGIPRLGRGLFLQRYWTTYDRLTMAFLFKSKKNQPGTALPPATRSVHTSEGAPSTGTPSITNGTKVEGNAFSQTPTPSSSNNGSLNSATSPTSPDNVRMRQRAESESQVSLPVLRSPRIVFL
jgi:hypothetical protein